MRFTASLLTAAALLFTIAPAALADSIQLSVNSTAHIQFSSPSSSWWGEYYTDPSFFAAPSTGLIATIANFSSVSLLIPEGDVISSATINIIVPTTEITGTGYVFPIQGLEPPFSGPSVAPTFGNTGTSEIMAYFVDSQSSPLNPIINGNEVSTGNLSLFFNGAGSIFDSVDDPGTNWYGYLGGSGEADIPYTVQLDVTYSPVPEPSSIALLGTGLFGLVGIARRRFLP